LSPVKPGVPKVYVVDDDPSIRRALSSLIRSVGLRATTFASAHAYLRRARVNEAACLVLDVRLRGLSGLDLQRELADIGVRIPIIFISGHGDIPMSVRAMKAGAIDFLPKPFHEQELLDAITRALRQGGAERRRRVESEQLNDRFTTLTPREREVAQRVAMGLLNKQVAAELGLSEITVKYHRRSVMNKMKAGSLPELVRMMATIA
jgi:FixJ family two-component response regulator